MLREFSPQPLMDNSLKYSKDHDSLDFTAGLNHISSRRTHERTTSPLRSPITISDKN